MAQPRDDGGICACRPASSAIRSRKGMRHIPPSRKIRPHLRRSTRESRPLRGRHLRSRRGTLPARNHEKFCPARFDVWEQRCGPVTTTWILPSAKSSSAGAISRIGTCTSCRPADLCSASNILGEPCRRGPAEPARVIWSHLEKRAHEVDAHRAGTSDAEEKFSMAEAIGTRSRSGSRMRGSLS